MNNLKFNEKLKYYREKANISKSELARKIHVSPSYITMLENGDKTNPSMELRIKLAVALNLDIKEFLTDNQKFNESLQQLDQTLAKLHTTIDKFSELSQQVPHSCYQEDDITTVPGYKELIIPVFMKLVNCIGLDFFNDLTTNEILRIINSEELSKTLEYLYFKEKNNRYNSIIEKMETSLNELKSK